MLKKTFINFVHSYSNERSLEKFHFYPLLSPYISSGGILYRISVQKSPIRRKLKRATFSFRTKITCSLGGIKDINASKTHDI